MLKTISAALLAVSVLAAPAMAASSGKTAQTPVIKAGQVKSSALNTEQVKPNVLNAKAKMGHRHHRHYSHRRSHKQMVALKKHFSKATIKHAAPATKRG